MAAKVISRPSEPVEPVFQVYGKGGGWFTAKELVERYAEWYVDGAFLPLGFRCHEEHPRVQEELDLFYNRELAKLESEPSYEEQERAEAKARWDRNKAGAARRMKK